MACACGILIRMQSIRSIIFNLSANKMSQASYITLWRMTKYLMFVFRVVDEDEKDLALGVANISISLLGQCIRKYVNSLLNKMNRVQYPTRTFYNVAI